MTDIHQVEAMVYNHAIDLFPTGSRVICNPPVMNTDEDWMILIAEEHAIEVSKYIYSIGFREGGSMEPHNDMKRAHSFKNHKNDLNLLITTDVEYFNGFRATTELATKLNLTKKKDRIKLFELAQGEYIS